MINTAKTLKTFFGGFGIPAYTLQSVPDTVALPYITYPLIEPEWSEQASFYAQVWYPKNKLSALLAKADQIAAAIGATGIKFEQPGGYLLIYPTTPLIQIITDESTQSAYINLVINAYQMPGYNPPAATPEPTQVTPGEAANEPDGEGENHTPGESPEEGV